MTFKKLLSILLAIFILFSFQIISNASRTNEDTEKTDDALTLLDNSDNSEVIDSDDSRNDNSDSENSDENEIKNEEQTDDTSEKNTVTSKEEFFAKTKPDYFVCINANTRKIYLNEYYYFTEEKFEKQKDELYDVLLEINEYCLKNGKNKEYERTDKSNFYRTFEISIHFQTESAGTYGRVLLEDNIISVLGNRYEIDEPDELIEYICDIFMKKLSSFETECDDKNYYYTEQYWTYDKKDDNTIIISTPDSENEFTLREILEFDVIMDESYFDTVFDEIADHGDTIHCKVEQWGGIGSKYILTLESNDGTRRYVYNHNGGSFGAETEKSLIFELRRVLDDNKHLLVYERGYKNDRLVLNGETGSAGVEKISIGIDMKKAGIYNTLITPEPLKGDLKKYEFYGTEEQLKSGNNMSYLFGFPAKEEYIKQQKEIADNQAPEQDPEKYETLMKGTRLDGGTIDYNINFIMEIPMNFNGNALPGWYKALGNDVKMVIMGITNIIDGKESKTDYTMIRFKGNKNEQWFTRSQTEFELSNNNDEYLTASTTYNSLISFDGYKRIRNTVEYDSMEATINYTNDDKMDLYSVSVKVGLKEAEFMADEIKYIGGGKARYDKLW